MDGALMANDACLHRQFKNVNKTLNSPESAWWEPPASSAAFPRVNGMGDETMQNSDSPAASSLENYEGPSSDVSEAGSGIVTPEDLSSCAGEDDEPIAVSSEESSRPDAEVTSDDSASRQESDVTGGETRPKSYLSNVVQELLHTEKSYVSDLQDIVEGYMKALAQSDVELISRPDNSALFGNIRSIHRFNRRFLACLNDCCLDPVKVAQCFVDNFGGFIIYADYCTNYPRSVEVIERLMRDANVSPVLKRLQLNLRHALPLSTYLFKPVQRILKYHLLLQSIANNHDASEPGHDVMVEALDCMVDVARHINELKRHHERLVRTAELRSSLANWQGAGGVDIIGFGNLVLEDDFRVTGSWNERHVILFHRAVLIAKKLKDGQLQTKAIIRMSNLTLVESVPREPLHFTICPFDNKKVEFTLQARNAEQKQTWCQEIKTLMIENFHSVIPEHAKEVVLGKTCSATNITGRRMHNDAALAAAMARRLDSQTSIPDSRRVRRKSVGSSPGKRDISPLKGVFNAIVNATKSSENIAGKSKTSGGFFQRSTSQTMIPCSDAADAEQPPSWTAYSGGINSGPRGRLVERRRSPNRSDRRSMSADSIACVVADADAGVFDNAPEKPDDDLVEGPTTSDIKNILFLAERTRTLQDFLNAPEDEDFPSEGSGEDSELTDDGSTESGEFCIVNDGQETRGEVTKPTPNRTLRRSPVFRAESFRRALGTGDGSRVKPREMLSKVLLTNNGNGVSRPVPRRNSGEKFPGEPSSEESDADKNNATTENSSDKLLPVDPSTFPTVTSVDEHKNQISNGVDDTAKSDSPGERNLPPSGSGKLSPVSAQSTPPLPLGNVPSINIVTTSSSSVSDDHLFYTDNELLAVTDEISAGVGDIPGETSPDCIFPAGAEELWPGRPVNYVYNLARAYSKRVKQMQSQATTSTSGRPKNEARKNPQVQQQLLFLDAEKKPDIHPSASLEKPADRNPGSRLNSCEEEVSELQLEAELDARQRSADRQRSASLDSVTMTSSSADISVIGRRSIRDTIRLFNTQSTTSDTSSKLKNGGRELDRSGSSIRRGMCSVSTLEVGTLALPENGEIGAPVAGRKHGTGSLIQERLRMLQQKGGKVE